MNKRDNPTNINTDVLSEEELEMLSNNNSVVDDVDVNSQQMKSLRSRVMSQLDKQLPMSIDDLFTVRSGVGDWEQISDKIRKKTLYVDEQKGVASYLLRIEPGAEDAPHQHSSDEHCLVIEGDISFGDIHLYAGDYHLAAKGSWHKQAYSEHGALLYIQTGVEQQMGL